MSLLLAITGWHVESWRERFAALLPELPIVTLGEPFDRRAVHYVASWKHPEGSLAGLPNLAAIFSLGAGVDHLFTDSRLPQAPIARVIDPDLTTRMSEYVVMHCLMQLRQQRRYERQQREKSWDDDRRQPAAREVRVGVMGLGELGQDAARKLQVIGFDVAGWSRSPKDLPGITCFDGRGGLDALLGRSRILICLLPLTPETDGILNANLFSKLPKGAFLINAARGGHMVEEDLIPALESGRLAHATLDVFREEPLPGDHPFWDHSQITVTPHNAAITDPRSVVIQILEDIGRHQRGEALSNQVDTGLGY